MSEPTTENLENLKKFPWQYAILILLGAIGVLFVQYVVTRDKGDQNCEVRIGNYAKALTKRDSTILMWQGKYISLSNELLYKNNIIDRQQDVITKTDSLARKKFEKPVKQILKDHE